jgi:ribonuclease PH
MVRVDGRLNDELRPVRITTGVQAFAEGSALIEMGLTKVICTVSVEDRVPPFLRGKGMGWITAEYAMLPRSTLTRTPREVALGRVGGRTQEIQRLIGRSLRAVAELSLLGERTFTVDCDVLQADGGTRTAAITGSYVALYQAIQNLASKALHPTVALRNAVAAVSVGVVTGEPVLDLAYEEDSTAEVDFNVVMTDLGHLVEVQGTAEGKPFSRSTMDSLLDLAEKGIQRLLQAQQHALESAKR